MDLFGWCRKFLLTFTFCLLFFSLSIFPSFTFTANASELSEIQQRGYIKIAVKDNLPPLGFRDAKGNLQGLEIDIAQRLAQDLLGKPKAFKLIPVQNRDRISQILENKVDILIARFTATESRSRLLDFSIPYYLDSALLVTKNTSLQRLSDFKQRKIGVLRGSDTIARIKYFIPNSELVGADSYKQGQNLLETGKIEAFAADGSLLSGWVKQNRQYKLLDIKLSTEPLCVVIAKGLQNDKLRRTVDSAIANYLETGWLQERIKYWGLPPSRLLDTTVRK